MMTPFSKIVFSTFIIALSALAYSQPIQMPVNIIGTGIHYGGIVIYRYQVKNNGTQNISRITLGYSGETDSSFQGFSEWPDDPSVALPMVGQWFPNAIITSPDGWGSALISTTNEGGQ